MVKRITSNDEIPGSIPGGSSDTVLLINPLFFVAQSNIT